MSLTGSLRTKHVQCHSEAAARLLSKGVRLTPVLAGSKQPVNAGWQRGEGAITDAADLNGSDYGVLIENGLLGVDIDVKKVDGLKFFSALTDGLDLPPTLHTHTRSGGMHLYYRLPADSDFKGPIKRDDLGVEVYTAGRQFVTIAEGYQVEINNIADVPVELLGRLSELRNDSAAPSEDKAATGRNTKLTSLAGAMRRQGADETTIMAALRQANASQFEQPLSDTEVTRIAKGILRYEPEPDVPLNLDSLLDELNSKHAVIRDGDKYKILQLTYDAYLDRDEPSLIGYTGIRLYYENQQKVFVTDKKALNQIDWWLQQPQRRELKGFVLDPLCKRDDVYNLWEGWTAQPDPDASCDLYLAHIHDNIAQGDSEICEYLLDWMADAIQNPTTRPGTSIVLRGGQGTGKGVFISGFGHLYGRHFVHIKDPDHFLGRFNKHLQYCLLLFADEAVWGGNKKAEGKLKGLITEDNIQIEAKFCDVRTMLNNVRVMMASNNEWVVPAGVDERRFFVIDVGSARAQDHTYFGALVNQMKTGGYGALLHLLQTRDLSERNLRQFPTTAALLEQKLASIEPELRFLYELARDGQLPLTFDGSDDVAVIGKKTLYDSYKQFCTDVGVRHKLAPSQFGKALSKVLPGLRERKPRRGNRLYLFPSLAEVREQLDRVLRQPTIWSAQTDWEGNSEF